MLVCLMLTPNPRRWTPLNVLNNPDGTPHKSEDPFLFKTKRGWHLLVHNQQGPQGESAYAYSEDGFSFTMSPTSPYGCVRIPIRPPGPASICTWFGLWAWAGGRRDPLPPRNPRLLVFGHVILTARTASQGLFFLLCFFTRASIFRCFSDCHLHGWHHSQRRRLWQPAAAGIQRPERRARVDHKRRRGR